MVVRTALGLVALFSRLSAPFIPFSAGIIAEAVGETDLLVWPNASVAAELERMPAGRTLTVPPVLFAKIEDEQVAGWAARFGGAEA